MVIQPPVGVVWMIKNLYFGGGWILYRKKKGDKNDILIDYGLNGGIWKNMTIIVNNDLFLSITNTSAVSNSFGFDGLVIQ